MSRKRKIACKICGKKFYQQGLNRHQAIHVGDYHRAAHNQVGQRPKDTIKSLTNELKVNKENTEIEIGRKNNTIAFYIKEAQDFKTKLYEAEVLLSKLTQENKTFEDKLYIIKTTLEL